MLDFKPLGSERISMLAEDTDSKHKAALYTSIVNEMPRSSVSAMEGTLSRIPMQFRRPTNARTSGPIGMNADTPLGEVTIAARNYKIERFSKGLPYNTSLQGDSVFDQVKNELLPITNEQVTYDIDSLLLTILAGTGAAERSRDVTTVDQSSAKFDSDATDVLGILGDAAENTGADFMFLSTDMARAFQKHAQFKEQSKSGISARASISAVVEVLMDHVGVREVIVGNRLYQDGSPHFALDINRAASGICYLAPKANLVKVPWKDMYSDEYEDRSKNQIVVRTEAYMDFIVADPGLSKSFTLALA